MLALSPPTFSSNIIGYNWDALSHEDQNYFCKGNNIILETENSSAQSDHLFLNFPNNSQPSDQLPNDDHIIVKKLNHNASERDRRKKINHLYSSLRNLLPQSNHTKKMSIPTTVSRVLKYIPEIQKEVEELIQKKEELLSKINSKQLQGISNLQVKQEINFNQKKKSNYGSEMLSLSTFSTTQLNDKQVALQISSHKMDKNPFSELLQSLEKDGFLVLDASSFESFGERIFHHLHLQVNGHCGALGDKLTSFCENKLYL